MSLTSVLYIAFLIIALTVYYTLEKNYRWIWLFVCSITFFILASGFCAFCYAILAIIITYFAALFLTHSPEKTSKIIMGCSLFLIMIELVLLKKIFPLTIPYNPISNLFSFYIGNKLIPIAIPLGISYYTLSISSYIIDVYRKSVVPEKNIFKLCLYTTYFPLITSGPIIRFNEVKEQLYKGINFDFKNIKFGFFRIIWGILKKSVVAERIHYITNHIYQNYNECSGLVVLICILLYFIELYMNFSGCMDIVLGSSQTFGIKLPEDFKNPFFSKSVLDFYRRWHITLSLWFKDYFFYPLMHSSPIRKFADFTENSKIFGSFLSREIPLFCVLFIVWIFLGIWHGIEMKYVFSTGILPFIYIVFERLLKPLSEHFNNKYKKLSESNLINIFRNIKTIFLISLCIIFFIAKSFSDGINIIQKAFTPSTFINGNNSLAFIRISDILIICIFFAAVLFLAYLNEKNYHIRDYINKKSVFLQIFVFLIGIFLIFALGIDNDLQSEFIYKKF